MTKIHRVGRWGEGVLRAEILEHKPTGVFPHFHGGIPPLSQKEKPTP